MIKKLSEHSVMSLLSQRRMASVPMIASDLAIPEPTAVGVLSRLFERGVVCRREVSTGQRGRPSYVYGIRLPKRLAAFHFDGTQLAAGILDQELTLLVSETVNVPRLTRPKQAAALVRETLYTLAGRASIRLDEDLLGAAVSINAIRTSGSGLTSSVLPWVDQTTERIFTTEVGVPVRLLGNPQVVAEYQCLQGAPPNTMAYLHAGDGVSGHFCAFGRAYRGANDRSGELGHMTMDPNGPACGCGRRGCLEALCSGPAIARQVREAGARPKAPAWLRRARKSAAPRALVELLWQEWQRKEPAAHALMNPVLDYLAWGLGLLVNLLDPELIVAGGYVLQNKPEWMQEVTRRAKPWILYGEDRELALAASQAAPQDYLRVIATQYHLRGRA